ncbi:hypothetical protein EMCRGX_G021796 [Ephydatia muelleri]
MQDSQWDDVHIFTCIPTLSGSILLAGPPSTFIIAKTMLKRWYSLLPPIWGSAKVQVPDHLVWARDWTHLDEQCGMDCQPPSR